MEQRTEREPNTGQANKKDSPNSALDLHHAESYTRTTMSVEPWGWR